MKRWPGTFGLAARYHAAASPRRCAVDGFAIIVIGASMGGVEALQSVAAGLPRDIPAALFVAQHVGRCASQMPRLLSRAGPLPAAHAAQGAVIRPGRIYVAPPDHHLLVERGHARLTRGPREN